MRRFGLGRQDDGPALLTYSGRLRLRRDARVSDRLAMHSVPRCASHPGWPLFLFTISNSAGAFLHSHGAFFEAGVDLTRFSVAPLSRPFHFPFSFPPPHCAGTRCIMSPRSRGGRSAKQAPGCRAAPGAARHDRRAGALEAPRIRAKDARLPALHVAISASSKKTKCIHGHVMYLNRLGGRQPPPCGAPAPAPARVHLHAPRPAGSL
jgi:hypothetical protein